MDEEHKSRENLKNRIRDYCKGVDVISLAHNVREGVEIISNLKPTLVFFDIQMQNETGLDLLEHYN